MRKSPRKFEGAWVAGLAVLLIAAMVTLLVLQNPEPAYAIRPWHSIACPGFPAGHIDEGDCFEASVRNTNTEGVSVGQRENFEVY